MGAAAAATMPVAKTCYAQVTRASSENHQHCGNPDIMVPRWCMQMLFSYLHESKMCACCPRNVICSSPPACAAAAAAGAEPRVECHSAMHALLRSAQAALDLRHAMPAGCMMRSPYQILQQVFGHMTAVPPCHLIGQVTAVCAFTAAKGMVPRSACLYVLLFGHGALFTALQLLRLSIVTDGQVIRRRLGRAVASVSLAKNGHQRTEFHRQWPPPTQPKPQSLLQLRHLLALCYLLKPARRQAKSPNQRRKSTCTDQHSNHTSQIWKNTERQEVKAEQSAPNNKETQKTPAPVLSCRRPGAPTAPTRHGRQRR